MCEHVKFSLGNESVVNIKTDKQPKPKTIKEIAEALRRELRRGTISLKKGDS